MTTIQFVNRIDELEFIRAKLKALQHNRKVFDFILTVSGIAGMGKTTLLQKTQEEAIKQNVEPIFIDMAFGKDDNFYLFRMIANQFFRNGEELGPFLMEAFIANFRLQLSQQPVVLLIDNIHLLPKEAQELLEEVLEQVYDEERLFLIMASRGDLRWDSFELRRRTRNIELNSFPKKFTEEFLADPIYQPMTDQIYNVTRGYPLAIIETQRWIKDHLNFTETNITEQFESQEAKLVFELFDTIFTNYILQDVETPNFMTQLLKNISPLRRFDDNILAMLLRKVEPIEFEAINTLYARAYIRQMAVQTYLIHWNSARMAYALDRPIRQLLSLEMQHRELDRLAKIHNIMAGWYQQAINLVIEKDKSSPQSVIYLIEHLYHYIHLQHLNGQNTIDIEIKVKDKILSLFKGYTPTVRIHFQEEFAKDEELSELLGDTYFQLSEFVVDKIEE